LECAKVKTKGKTSFVGGASNGKYGMACFDFNAAYEGTARARYFQGNIFYFSHNLEKVGFFLTMRLLH